MLQLSIYLCCTFWLFLPCAYISIRLSFSAVAILQYSIAPYLSIFILMLFWSIIRWSLPSLVRSTGVATLVLFVAKAHVTLESFLSVTFETFQCDMGLTVWNEMKYICCGDPYFLQYSCCHISFIERHRFQAFGIFFCAHAQNGINSTSVLKIAVSQSVVFGDPDDTVHVCIAAVWRRRWGRAVDVNHWLRRIVSSLYVQRVNRHLQLGIQSLFDFGCWGSGRGERSLSHHELRPPLGPVLNP